MFGLGAPELFICAIILGVLFLLMYAPVKRGFDEGYEDKPSSTKAPSQATETAPEESAIPEVVSAQPVSSTPSSSKSKPSMEYGATNKDYSWKLGCLIAVAGIPWPVLAFTEPEQSNTGLGIGLFLFFLGVGFLLTIPYGTRPIPKKPKEKRSMPPIVVFFTSNLLFLLLIGWLVFGFYYGFKLFIALGDLVYTTLWKVIRMGK